jgi:hypothetical protein
MPLNVDLVDKLSASCPALATVLLCTPSSFHMLGEQLKIGLSEYLDHDGSEQAEYLSLPPDILCDTLSLDTC